MALSGDGGDELFGGYQRYALARHRWRRVSAVPWSLRQVAAAAAAGTGLPRMRRLGRMVAAQRPEDLYRVLLTHWLDPTQVVLGSKESSDALSDLGRPAALADPSARLMQLDAEQYLPDAVLVKVDRAAMSTSLETRVSLLDPRVVELAWRLPVRLRTGGPTSAGKVVLRRVLDRYVPRHLVERPRSGFGVPIGTWLRGPLREWAEDVLSQERLQRQGLLDPLVVRGVWDDHVSGRRNAEHELWTVLMLHAWLEHGERRRTDHVSCDPQPLIEPIHPGG